ncbi:MAG: type 1 glutamine amidotransferase [Acidobacteria bacterium]|nr:MAG: type 1 glutamine amidotransferase [Acidobacteriota bacterium]
MILIQVRGDEAAEAQEQLCFLETAGLEADEMDCINVVREPAISWSRVDSSDVLFLGGAGAHSATREFDFTKPLGDLVLRWIEEGRPLFGSCWGHHFLVQTLGGEVVTDHATGEVGSFDIELTKTGVDDPLFAGFPDLFAAQLGHHDRVERLPVGCEELAFSDRCRYQVLRLGDRPVYGTQFHSEMNESHLQARLMMYRDTYLEERTGEDELSATLRPSPHAELLLSRFLDLYA